VVGNYKEGGMPSEKGVRSHVEELLVLNQSYLDAIMQRDASRFEEILAADFLCSNPDGSVVDKPGFLAQIAQPLTISGLSADDIRVRVLGNIAIIHARTTYQTLVGDQRHGRYTDVWQLRNGTWQAVAAHVTR
jgi:hypothetical protein